MAIGHQLFKTLLSCAIFALPVVIALPGCSSQSSLGDVASNSAALKTTAAPAPQTVLNIVAKVALSSITGPPNEIAALLKRKLDAAATAANIALLTDAGAVGDYRLKGYLVATRSAKGIELSYIWDVFNNRGKRVDRRSGNETIAGSAKGSNLWSKVPSQVYQKIADLGIATVTRRLPARQIRPASGPTAQIGLRQKPPKN